MCVLPHEKILRGKQREKGFYAYIWNQWERVLIFISNVWAWKVQIFVQTQTTYLEFQNQTIQMKPNKPWAAFCLDLPGLQLWLLTDIERGEKAEVVPSTLRP